jgi:hypothetical protein
MLLRGFSKSVRYLSANFELFLEKRFPVDVKNIKAKSTDCNFDVIYSNTLAGPCAKYLKGGRKISAFLTNRGNKYIKTWHKSKVGMMITRYISLSTAYS